MQSLERLALSCGPVWIRAVLTHADKSCSAPCVLQEKASRVEHIMSEHQLFLRGLRDLHNWVSDTSHMMHSYCAPTADRSVLDSRMIKLEVWGTHKMMFVREVYGIFQSS